MIIPIKEYERLLEELEELDEIRAFDEAEASGETPIPFQRTVSETNHSEVNYSVLILHWPDESWTLCPLINATLLNSKLKLCKKIRGLLDVRNWLAAKASGFVPANTGSSTRLMTPPRP